MTPGRCHGQDCRHSVLALVDISECSGDPSDTRSAATASASASSWVTSTRATVHLLHEAAHRLLLGVQIEAGGRLVGEDERGLEQHRPDDRQPLQLPPDTWFRAPGPQGGLQAEGGHQVIETEPTPSRNRASRCTSASVSPDHDWSPSARSGSGDTPRT